MMRTTQAVFTAVLIGLLVGMALVVWLFSAGSWFGLWLAVMGLLTYLLYGWDKYRAITGGRRIPERTLHLAALAGGFAGGWAGRAVFRHKTRKPVFLWVLMLATLLYGAVWLLGGWLWR